MATACGRGRTHEKHELVRLPSSYRSGTLVADATHWAYVVTGPDGQHVVTRDGPGPAFRDIFRPVLAPRSGRVLYWARETLEGQGGGVLVADGQIVAHGFGRIGIVVFTEDGTHWAAVTGTPPLPEGGAGPVVVMADGQELGRPADASKPTLSPDGRHLAYLEEDSDGRVTLAVDGTRRTTYAQPQGLCGMTIKTRDVGPNMHAYWTTQYLADGSLLVTATDGDGWSVFRNETRLATYAVNAGNPHIQEMVPSFGSTCGSATRFIPASIAVAADAPVAVWWERLAGDLERWRVVANGAPVDDVLCGHYWDDPIPEVSADGKHVAYPCTGADPARPDLIYVIKDGRRFGPYKDAWAMAFASDGSRLAYDASTGDPHPLWTLWVDGTAVRGGFHSLWHPRFGPDGTHVLWEGQEVPDPTKGLLGIDARTITRFDEILWGPEFPDGRHPTWVFRRGRRVVRLDLLRP